MANILVRVRASVRERACVCARFTHTKKATPSRLDVGSALTTLYIRSSRPDTQKPLFIILKMKQSAIIIRKKERNQRLRVPPGPRVGPTRRGRCPGAERRRRCPGAETRLPYHHHRGRRRRGTSWPINNTH